MGFTKQKSHFDFFTKTSSSFRPVSKNWPETFWNCQSFTETGHKKKGLFGIKWGKRTVSKKIKEEWFHVFLFLSNFESFLISSETLKIMHSSWRQRRRPIECGKTPWPRIQYFSLRSPAKDVHTASAKGALSRWVDRWVASKRVLRFSSVF